MSRAIALPTTLAAFALGACGQDDRAEWQAIEVGPESTLFMDVTSVKKVGSIATFWTKLDHSSWWRRQLKPADVRTKREIDCHQRTARSLPGGGIFVDGKLSTPFQKHSSGKIASKGYLKLLYDRVCR